MNPIEEIMTRFRDPARKFAADYPLISRTKASYEELFLDGSSDILLIDRVLEVIHSSPPRNNAAILGGFGTGKTAFAFNFLYETLCRWLEGDFPWLPVLLRFRNYQESESLFSWFIEEIFVATGMELEKRHIIKLLQDNRMLLILDGLDELPSSSDRTKVNRLLADLNKLAVMRSPVLITCRTNFFPAVFEEESALKKFHRLYVKELEQEQIERIVYKTMGTKKQLDPDTFLKEILHDPDLSALARRPLFLDMLTKLYQSEGSLEVKNIAGLFRQLTNSWLASESHKESSQLDASEKRQIFQELAFYQFLEQSYATPYEDLKKILKAETEKLRRFRPGIDLPAVVREISGFGLLDRPNNNDQFSFAHSSLRDFFIAEKLANELIDRQYENFGKRALQEEIFEFLSLILENRDKFYCLEEGVTNPDVFFVARGNLIPPIRKQVKKESIPGLLQVHLRCENPLIRFMSGYTLPVFQQRYPEVFEQHEVQVKIKQGYLQEVNALVRLRMALLLTGGRYHRTKEFPELSPDYSFELEDLKPFVVKGFQQVFEKIIRVDRENEFVIEESIRVLMIYAEKMKPDYIPAFLELMYQRGIRHSSPRVRRMARIAVDQLKDHSALSDSDLQFDGLQLPAAKKLPSSGWSKEELDWVDLLRETVDASMEDPSFGVSQLAEMMASSERNLHRKVKEYTQKTPNTYIQQRRLAYAKELLENRVYPTVKQVCFAIGFKKPDYFSTLFEKHHGRRPSSYL
jgi:AraC-like DNA-binding protein